MIAFRQLALVRGGEPLIEPSDLIINDGEKVGIVGTNGAGKSSLFALMLGELAADRGELAITNGARIAHMAQEIDARDRTITDYVLDGDHALRAVEQQIDAAQQAGDDMRYAELLGELEHHDGYTARPRAEQLLVGLGFAQHELDQPLSAFSGGWRMRANLARTLFTPSDILLLDEPTNHLDLDALFWLEQWLVRYPGTLLLISHDRDFLDGVCNRILHFDQRQLVLYTANYSSFERMRAERLASREAERVKQEARRAELEDFVRRFRAKATKARQAQSRLKMLERMGEIAPLRAESPFTFSIDAWDKISFPLLSLDQANIGYAEPPVLKHVRLSLAPGDRIGLLGPNGAGKSTLIKALTGDLPLLSGERVEGEHLKLGYFAQHQVDALDLDASAYLHIQRMSPQSSEQEIRNFLGGFDFRGDDAFAAVGQFSGGEKARVALALIAWQKPNLLLLDEPTNHLDLEMREALTDALARFEGAVVIVSHDRHLMRASVDRFWCVADGQVAPFDGDLDDYQRWLKERGTSSGKAKAAPEIEQSAAEPEVESPASTQADKRQQRKQSAAQREQLKPLKKARDAAEKKMSSLQKEMAVIEERLGDQTLYSDENKAKLLQLTQQRGELGTALEDAEQQWLEAEEALEAAQQ
ncbi:ABC-F family ATP-binding cassette domain-containing protein [Carnimonas bestiolae]|uniref:ABC-F family ATP-binding cassette domain-containing protein n=1 Tax=Carnimonas bestiolae TaxID=3402172 RepID=UPI003EDC21D1